MNLSFDGIDRLIVEIGQRKKEKKYWLKKMSGDLLKTAFPYDWEKRAREKSSISLDINEVNLRFPGEISSKMVYLSNESDDMLHVILAAGLNVLLEKYTGFKDILVGTPIYKQESEREFINTVLVLRNQLRSDMSFKELLVRVRQTVIEAVEHQNYPVALLVDELNIPLTDTEEDFPLFDVSLVLENIHDEKYLGHIRHNMICSFLKGDRYVEGVIKYNASRYRKETVERIAAHFVHLYRQVLFHVDTPIGQIELLSLSEKEELLYDLNDTRTEFPKDKTIRQLFEEQVEQTPDAVALIFEDKKLTYRELNKRANRLAGILREKGVKANSIVGLMVDRSLEMMIAILAILKSGGAYLPITPDTPEKRVLTMLEDCRASVLLTESCAMEEFRHSYLQNLRTLKLRPHVTGIRPQVKDLDRLPFPDRSLVNYEKYSPHIGQTMAKNSITMQATRGCPYNCAYCHKIWPKSHVYRSAQHVFQELMTYYNMGVRRFAFIDDVFNLNKENSRQFFQLIIDNDLDVQLFFPAGLRGDILTKDYIDLMVKAGTVGLGLALETASPRLQKLIGKNLKLEKLREMADYFCKTYPQVLLELFIMTGFPTETKEDALSTMDFVKNVKWADFPYLSIVRIYSNTDMEKLALANGVPKTAISMSEHLAYHEMPHTLPFEKSFMSKYQADFMNEYFLCRERLLTRLPYQMKVLTEDELVQKYDSYLPVTIRSFADLLEFVGIDGEELGAAGCLGEEVMKVPDLHEKMKKHFPREEPDPDALKVLLLDVSQYFTHDEAMLFDVVEPPLGLMYVLTYLKHRLGGKVNGKIAKSRVDFRNYEELKQLLETFEPDVIGIRSLTFYKDLFHQAAGVIRQWDVDVPIIAGGPYATTNYQEILQDRNINVVVKGEGEITFCQLIEKLMENDGKLPREEVLKEIPGLAFIPEEEKSRHQRFAREILLLDTMKERLSRQSGENPGQVNRSDSMAYAIYTSGSTGKPRAVLPHHYNVTRVVLDTNYIDIDKNDRILQLSNYSFDGSVFDIYGALLNGAALVIVPTDDLLAVDKLADLITGEAITVFFVTTAYFNTLVDIKLQCFKNIRAVLFGGERVSVAHTQKALEYMGKGRILHMYGPTETTVYSTFYYIDAIDERLDTIPIGKPLSNTTMYVFDKNGQLVPPGAPGELYIGGPAAAKGYLNQPELTREKFVENPYIKGERIYRTGDLVRMLPGGDIVFMDRIDRQVKIRGFRIEMGEIEHLLINYEGIKEAVVVTREKDGGERYLTAYFVTGEINKESFNVTDLREFLLKELPHFMVPSYFVQMDKLPLNPNGKVDIKQLPLPEDRNTSNLRVAPRDALEKKIAQTWAEVLEINKDIIGIEDDFFELGGHSLKAIMLISKIEKETNIKITLPQLFSEPTIMAISEYIKMQGTPKDTFVSIEPAEKKEYYPLSSAQQRLFVLHQLDKNATNYNIPLIWNIDGELDKEKFQETFRYLVKRHEILRTSFKIVQQRGVQQISPGIDFEIDVYTGSEKEAAQIVNDFVKPFDLSQPPLLRVGLVEIEKTRHIFMFDMHHIITDGTSHKTFTWEFITWYEGGQLPGLNLQYKDFSQWQNRSLQSGEIKKQEEYWLKEFEGEIPVIHLPTDYPRPSMQSFEGKSLTFQLTDEETRQFNKLAKQEEVTLFMLSLAIFDVMLSRASGQQTIIVGTPIIGRRHADLQHIIGIFINTLALKQHVSGEKTFKRFLQELKQRTLEAFENQEYQFENLVHQLKLERDLSRNPLFDVMFAFENFEAPSIDVPGPSELSKLTRSDYQYENNAAQFDLYLTGKELDQRLFFTFVYCTKLFKKETIQRFTQYFKKIISEVVKNPDKKLNSIDIIPGEEKNRLLMEFNDTTLKYSKDKPFDQLFAERVERTPDHIAVVGQPVGAIHELPIQITYKELDRKSHQLAEMLRTKKVKPDTIVGIIIDRSIDMMIGILGILKAGAAFLPIDSDPDFPRERIKYMLADSGVNVLVTSRSLSEKISFEKDILYLEDYRGFQPGSQIRVSGRRLRAANLAYVIYTSGSTGSPKGVMIEHMALHNFIEAMADEIQFTPGKTILALTTISFDIFVLETLLSISRGLRVVIAHERHQGDINLLEELIIKNNIEMVQATPSRMQMFTAGKGTSTCFQQLKEVIVGGEAFPDKLLGELKDLTPARIYNVYGPTETTVWSTLKDLTSAEFVDIGHPLANTRVYILDKDNKLQSTGVVGELYIGGDGIARGYINSPELTAEKFRGVTNDRLYRTGDLARWKSDGDIECLGRIDQQIKIRGNRIECGEIESHLVNHKKIKEAVVIPGKWRDNHPVDPASAAGAAGGEMVLCAYIVTSEENIDASELREYLRQQLPLNMIPAHFIKIENIPYTPNGKVDKKSLYKLGKRLDTGTPFVPSKTQDEKRVDEIWKQLLRVEDISIDDNFFDLGGNSITIIELTNRINEEFGTDISMEKVFRFPTIRTIVKYLHQEETAVRDRSEILQRSQKDRSNLLQRRKVTRPGAAELRSK